MVCFEPSQSSPQAKAAAPMPAATLSTTPNLTTSVRLSVAGASVSLNRLTPR